MGSGGQIGGKFKTEVVVKRGGKFEAEVGEEWEVVMNVGGEFKGEVGKKCGNG